jgi:cell division protease FtsH
VRIDPGMRQRPQQPPRPRRLPRGLLIWLLVALVALSLFNLLSNRRGSRLPLPYSRFEEELASGNVAEVVFRGREIVGELNAPVAVGEGGRVREGLRFQTKIPFEDPDLVQRLRDSGVGIKTEDPSLNWFHAILSWGPWVLILAFWIYLLRQMQAGGTKAFSFGKSKAKLLLEDKPKVTFRDVAGSAEAKQELQEVIEFLKDPRKFQKLGGKIPKGVLLLGPPGTGKTLLARAVAGEAEVPFFSMSGSDFVEMFVGVGASRVRDLFDQGKRNAPCIIFIDEIDAVGRQRGAGLGGGHDEREQTLNQLLVEMDGFESNEGVILLAATNRPDVLDPALLRPGRFDRQIVVDRPDLAERRGILQVHTRSIPLARNVSLTVLARGTPGLSGADLANLVNEAALLAARRNRRKVTMADFEEAKDKVMMGMERRSLIISEEEKRSTAYHEAGHVLVAKLTPGSDPVHKVTIIPRGRALGLTSYLPLDERHTYSKQYCLNMLSQLMGGRAADELVLGQMTTGAGDDIERGTELARKMVCEWGMSEELGPLTFGQKEEQIFLGREIAQRRDYSERTAQLIDREVRRLVEQSYQRARKLLEENLSTLHALADALLEHEILDGADIDKIVKGKALPRRGRRRRSRHPGTERAAAATTTSTSSTTEASPPSPAG